MTPRTPVGAPNPVYVCERFGLEHRTRFGGEACHGHSKREPFKCCTNAPHPGAVVCHKHGAKAGQVKAAAKRVRDRQAGEAEVERLRPILGVEAADEPHDVTALREIRKARGNVAAWQALVDERVVAHDGDVLVALAVHTGNPKKPNEVEKHFALARLDEERDRLMQWIAVARKLGIEQARLEQQERMAEADADRAIAVIRLAFDALRAELLERGADRKVIEATYREAMPSIVRKAIDLTETEVG